MKTSVILTLACLFVLATGLRAQDLATLQDSKKETKKLVKAERKELKKLSGPYVSIVSKRNFDEDFSNASNVVWRRSKTFDEATFTMNGQAMTAYYDSGSKLVGTTTHIKFSNLPVKAQNEIKTKYKDYSVKEVILFDDNEANDTDMIMWGSQFDDADNYFVVLAKANNELILRVDPEGYVYFFKKM